MALTRVKPRVMNVLGFVLLLINFVNCQNASLNNEVFQRNGQNDTKISEIINKKQSIKINTEILETKNESAINGKYNIDNKSVFEEEIKAGEEDLSNEKNSLKNNLERDSSNVVAVGSDVKIQGSVEKDPIIKQLLLFKDIEVPDEEAWTKMSWLVELFDQHKWNVGHYGNASKNCSNDVMVYLDALKSGKAWAAKMWDSSGRYNGQFFFGNDFWLGSAGLCEELQLIEGPPFAASFSVARLILKAGEYTPQKRTVLMGICMPSSCSSGDLETILRAGAQEAEGVARDKMAAAINKIADARNGGNSTETLSLEIVNVRAVPGSYNMWKDTKFFILLGVGSATVVLMLIASCYEMYVSKHNSSYQLPGPSQASDGDGECHNNNVAANGSGKYRNGSSQTANGNGNGNGNGTFAENTCERERKTGTGVCSQILLSFSAISNTEKIMRTEESSEDSISCIHGLRFLSLAWVIMVHTYLQVFAVSDNKALRIIIERNFFYQTVGNASYSVDTFFFISGLLVTFLYYKSMDSKKKALAKRHARMPSKSSQASTNGHQFSAPTNINGETRSKIQQQHQYTYTNAMMMQTPRLSSDQSIDEFQQINTVFTRQTCPKEVRDNTFEFLELLFYRIVRLTPAYLFAIGINELALKYSHNNSVFEPMIIDHVTCDKYWWRNMLYINNLYPQTEMCMIWSWYMANDTQFYIIGIILLLISKRYFKFSAIILFLLMISSWLVTGYISLANNYRAKIQEPFEMFDQLYDKPWSRLGPYLVGMVTGWCLWRVRGKVLLPAWAGVLGWPISIGIIASLVYGMKDGYLELWPTAFYVSIGHTAWGVAIAWVVLWCVSRRDGLLSRLLGYRGVLPLSRLAYCAYLVHPTIMMLSTFQMDGPVHLHNGMILIIYAGNAVMSYLMSFAISLAFEAPIVRLLKINYLRPNRNKHT